MFSLTAITERVGLGGMSTGVHKMCTLGPCTVRDKAGSSARAERRTVLAFFSRQQGEHRKSLKQHRTHPLSRLSRAVVLHAATT